VFGSIDRFALVARWRDTACVLRIGEHRISIADVSDDVVEHDEQTWAAVDAHPRAGEQS
jgi:hypothetical protein